MKRGVLIVLAVLLSGCGDGASRQVRPYGGGAVLLDGGADLPAAAAIDDIRSSAHSVAQLHTWPQPSAPLGSGNDDTPSDPVSPPLCGNGVRDPGELCDWAAQGCCNESCDGVLAASTICRPVSGPCDFAEVCDGATPVCPLDRVAPSSLQCGGRGSNPCDANDYCDGVGKQCPDTLAPAGKICRASIGPCDEAEVCDGAHKDCPEDTPSSTLANCAVLDAGAP